ncbi:TetR/AcrR family transcriptional regulator [Phenylobacterium sp. LjRoot219]|uniref:TetR/AcrR family transcriptional regulator n=1 Tax=Phenylobacterium sp. LjRoot219 TaxID=3342283 RepID=UPI003ED01415
MKSPPSDLVQPRRPRGRPKAEDLAGLEARLIQVGRELFFRDGYGATSMSEVARAARASKTTLYSRFPSKAALFRAIVAAQIESWDTGVHHTPIEGCDTLEEVLLVYGDILMRAAMTPEFIQLNRLLYSEAGRFPELAEIAEARVRRGTDYIAGQIRAFAARNGAPCRDPEAAAELFLMTLNGWASAVVLGGRSVGADARRAWLQHMVRSLLDGRSSW